MAEFSDTCLYVKYTCATRWTQLEKPCAFCSLHFQHYIWTGIYQNYYARTWDDNDVLMSHSIVKAVSWIMTSLKLIPSRYNRRSDAVGFTLYSFVFFTKVWLLYIFLKKIGTEIYDFSYRLLRGRGSYSLFFLFWAFVVQWDGTNAL
jgi:hypothetical protein